MAYGVVVVQGAHPLMGYWQDRVICLSCLQLLVYRGVKGRANFLHISNFTFSLRIYNLSLIIMETKLSVRGHRYDSLATANPHTGSNGKGLSECQFYWFC